MNRKDFLAELSKYDSQASVSELLAQLTPPPEQLSPEGAVKELNELQEADCDAQSHIRADRILLAVLRFGGFHSVAKAYELAAERNGFCYDCD